MPSFAKKNTAADSNPLAGLWKDPPNPSVVDELLADARVRAAEILRDAIPARITHLRALVAQEDDPSSLLYKGHLEGGDYAVPRMVQPDTIPRLVQASVLLQGRGLNPEDVRPGETIVLPDDVAVPRKPAVGAAANASGTCTPDPSGLSTPGSEKSEDTLVGDHTKLVDGIAAVSAEGPDKGAAAGPHWFEVVPRNKIQTELSQLMIKEHEELNRLTSDLRLWLELEIPLIEDGNSFGAEVQNHLIKELDLAFKRAHGFSNTMRQHHLDRIKLVQDWVRYPNLMDYPAAISNSDRLDHFLARTYLRHMLTIYGGLMTKFQRNWEKVINPKGNGGAATGGMY